MQDPLDTINEVFKKHDKACHIAIDVRTRHISGPRLRMIRDQLQKELQDSIVSLHSGYMRIALTNRVSA
jgi:hypothetical protein